MKITSGAARWRSPALTTNPQIVIEIMKPDSPTIISGLRP